MSTHSIKQAVVESYGKLAKSTKKGLFSSLFACCEPGEHADQVGKMIGYSREELDAVPDGSNLGVGCGNPSALAEMKAGDTVVDLGSGAGFDAFLVAPIVGQTGKVIGIDLSYDMLELARMNAQQGDYHHVKFIKGDIEDLPLDSDMAEHIISNCVINLSLNKDKVYQEAYRVLKVGGKLSVSDVVLQQELPAFVKESLAGHIACISGAELLDDYLQYVKAAGFRDIQVIKKGIFPIDYMLADPQVRKIAQEMNFQLDSEEAKDIASRLLSISITAYK